MADLKKKKQHWIPSSYLSAWCDPDVPKGQDPYVWMFSSDGKISENRAPKNIFYETDMYTIYSDTGERILALENGLSQLEKDFAKVRRDVIIPRKPLSNKDKAIVCTFIVAMKERTRCQRNHVKNQWGKALELMEYMKEEFANATPEQRKAMMSVGRLSDGPTLSMNDVKGLAERPLQKTLVPAVEGQSKILIRMNLCFLCTDDDIGFITSDDPCVWYDPEAYKRPAMYRGPGLGFKTIEVTFPISPQRIALLTWKPLPLYVDLPEKNLNECNRRIRAFADEYFVVRRNMTKPIWFKIGNPPLKHQIKLKIQRLKSKMSRLF